MADNPDNMVLRTLYLPVDLDQTLKSAALRGARSKGDIIRELIRAGLQSKMKEPGSYFVEPAGKGKAVRPAPVTRSLVKRAAKRGSRQARKAVA